MDVLKKTTFLSHVSSETKSFFLGYLVAALMILPPAIYANNAQKEFIALQGKVISLYKRKDELVGIRPSENGEPLVSQKESRLVLPVDDRAAYIKDNMVPVGEPN